MQKLAIIQNGKSKAPSLIRLCDGALSGFELLSVAGSVGDGIRAIKQNRPDFVLVDVNLPDGCGFKVFEATQDLSYGKAVFCPDNSLWLRAERFKAMLLCKDESEAELKRKLALVLAGPNNSPVDELYTKSVRTWANQKLQQIFVSSPSGNMFLDASQVMSIVDEGNQRRLRLVDGPDILSQQKLRSFFMALALGDFALSSRKALLNLSQILPLGPEQILHQILMLNGDKHDLDSNMISYFRLKFNAYKTRSALR